MKAGMKSRQADRHHIFRPIKRNLITEKKLVNANGTYTTVRREMTMAYNLLGRKVLGKNPELFRIFRQLKDLPVEELVSKAKQGIDLGYAKITHYKERFSEYSDVASHILRITLSNGREFAFKISNKKDNDLRQDLAASYAAMKLKAKSIKCYVQFQFPGAERYFVLMELSKLPTLNEFIDAQKKIRVNNLNKIIRDEADERIRAALAAQVKVQRKLAGTGLLDVLRHNMFVRETPQGKIEMVLFDLGLKKKSPKPKHYIE